MWPACPSNECPLTGGKRASGSRRRGPPPTARRALQMSHLVHWPRAGRGARRHPPNHAGIAAPRRGRSGSYGRSPPRRGEPTVPRPATGGRGPGHSEVRPAVRTGGRCGALRAGGRVRRATRRQQCATVTGKHKSVMDGFHRSAGRAESLPPGGRGSAPVVQGGRPPPGRSCRRTRRQAWWPTVSRSIRPDGGAGSATWFRQRPLPTRGHERGRGRGTIRRPRLLRRQGRRP